MTKPVHRTNRWKVLARRICAAAYANPETKCWRCGRTLAQHPPGDRWQAGHVDDTNHSLILPEARSCNASHGARYGAQLQAERAQVDGTPRGNGARWMRSNRGGWKLITSEGRVIRRSSRPPVEPEPLPPGRQWVAGPSRDW